MIFSKARLSKYLLYTLLTLSSVQLSAQSDVSYLVNEDFSDLSSDFYTGVTKDHELSIANGKYIIKTGKNSIWPHVETYPCEKQHFKIETNLALTDSKKGSGAGLMWGGDDGENFYIFMINEMGYSVWHHTEDALDFVLEWKLEKVNTSPASNKLSIEQDKGALTLSINDQEIYKGKSLPFHGSCVGFFVQGGSSVAIDDLVMTTPELKIELAATTQTTKTALGPSVNSKEGESLAQISPDGNFLYFFRRYHHPENGNEKEGEAWMATKAGNWASAQPLAKPINCSRTNFVATVLPDNNTLMCGNTYDASGEITGEGFSVSSKAGSGWGIPQNLNIEGYHNDRNSFEGCMSADQKILIMSSKRSDTKGGGDLYVSFHIEGNNWTKPKHMGNVNTDGTELFPFLAPDERTLYFSSNGWPGFGGHDIFITHRLDDSWQQWSTPKNLGSTINTAHSDCGISVSAKGDKAYISSISKATGSFDIYEAELTQSMKPDPVLLIKGMTLDKTTLKPLSTAITIHDLATDKEVGIAHSDPLTGKYEIVLQQGKEYSFFADKKDYYAIREHMDLSAINEYKELSLDLFLVPMQVGKNIKLNNVFFEHALATLKPESEPELKSLVKLMKDNTKIRIRIEGHTDNQGPDDLNMKLSEDRAATIKAYLIEKGIDESRLESVGLGETKPVADNKKPHLRKLNRRVEFVLLGV